MFIRKRVYRPGWACREDLPGGFNKPYLLSSIRSSSCSSSIQLTEPSRRTKRIIKSKAVDTQRAGKGLMEDSSLRMLESRSVVPAFAFQLFLPH